MLNQDLIVALNSQIDLLEKQMDENFERIVKLQSDVDFYRDLNKEAMKKVRDIAKQIRTLKGEN